MVGPFPALDVPLKALCCNGRMSHLPGDLTIVPTQDTALLAEIHFHTVSTAYRELFPQDVPPPTTDELTAVWKERLTDETASAFAASLQGNPVGAVGIRQDPDFEVEGQLLGLHVLPDHWGQGFGGALHDTAVGSLKAQRYTEAGLWVIASNSRARRMYEERGWVLVPGVELDLLGIREVRYHKVI
jgi:ribosomal protein S18 acetylase RimI-like enzyme